MNRVYPAFVKYMLYLARTVFFTSQGVESERCASFQAAMDAGHPVKIEANQSLTLADGEFCGLYEIVWTSK